MRKTILLLIKFAGLLILFVVCVVAFFSFTALIRESDTVTIAPPNGQFVETEHGRMHIQTRGDSTNPAVLLIHGMAAWSGTWHKTIDALVAQNYYVIAVDLPPFGFSERPESQTYSRTFQAARIAGVLEELDIQKVTIVGHSFGGRATVETALAYPELIENVVLVDVALDQIYGEPVSSLPNIVKVSLGLEPVRYGLVATTMTNPLLLKSLIKLFVYKKDSIDSEVVDTYGLPSTLKHSTRDLGFWMYDFISNVDAGLSTNPANYQMLPRTTKIIWGTNDTITPLSQAEVLLELIPGSELTVLEDVGHIPQIENSEKFNSALLRVLK